ncbi:C40 family peptidase [Dysgonomonas sp. GY75]|uniref:C40 family peptidase n=1 Tax=Dysgonomonas sp. GY75 TaxID=2780419 RepID=UPI0018848085|nr:SH3 domain-containing C40 family peptidase [Dysgonomonas sp. GY75]MBF0649921.1 C40 family peptidase [Dysgonomonas sp. GY75]
MRINNITKLVAATLILLSACQNKEEKTPYPELNALVDSARMKHVPDRRDNVYDIKIVENEGKPVIKGVTSLEEAKADLLELIRKSNPAAIDSISVLPDETVGEKTYGVINVSVADVRMGASYAAEMGTQLLLGAPVQVLQHDDWWRIKTAEGYVAWTTGGSFVRMTKDDFNKWITAKKIIFTDDYGFGYENPDEKKQRVSDLAFGNMLKLEADNGRFYKVSYPDGRIAYILKSQSKPYEEWLASVKLTEESILEKALSLKGIPYTWGGTSVKGMDCSGFTKTVMLMHGIILMRDASQQVKTGIPVDISNGYENLRPGDLMFFGKKAQDGKKERIRHVAFYKGDKEFIHASGYIRINSLDSTKANYDELNTREFVRASRVIGAVDTKGIWSINNSPLYKEQK